MPCENPETLCPVSPLNLNEKERLRRNCPWRHNSLAGQQDLPISRSLLLRLTLHQIHYLASCILKFCELRKGGWMFRWPDHIPYPGGCASG